MTTGSIFSINKAKEIKNDEFYTRLEDIESELAHYTDQLVGKTVYYNCDNPEFSNFWKYFVDNFERLRLKRLISTYIVQDSVSYKYEMKTAGITIKTALNGNGDFRSDECIKILEECDIVITNPPFSLFREFIKQVMTFNKDFLVVGSIMVPTMIYLFRYMSEERFKCGYTTLNKFITHDNNIKNIGARWFTTLSVKQQNGMLELTKTYKESEYRRFDNLNAIEVRRIKDIPYDYFDKMGVPATIMYKNYAALFDIVGHGYTCAGADLRVDGKKTFVRIIIKRKTNESSN